MARAKSRESLVKDLARLAEWIGALEGIRAAADEILDDRNVGMRISRIAQEAQDRMVVRLDAIAEKLGAFDAD